MSNWISVDERLPSNNDYYLVYVVDGSIEVDYYNLECGHWQWRNGDHYNIATHWQPLPEPPEGVDYE